MRYNEKSMSLLSGINIDDQGHVSYPQLGKRRRWFLRILLTLFLIISLIFAPRLQSSPLIITLETGVDIEYKEFAQEKITLDFGLSIDEVQQLLGPADAQQEGLLIYNQLGLNLYVDEQQGLDIIGYFNDSYQLNPLDVPGRWQVGRVRLDAGFAGVRFNQLTNKLDKEFEGQRIDGYNVQLRYDVMGNTLRIEADERGRLAFIAYHHGKIEDFF